MTVVCCCCCCSSIKSFCLVLAAFSSHFCSTKPAKMTISFTAIIRNSPSGSDNALLLLTTWHAYENYVLKLPTPYIHVHLAECYEHQTFGSVTGINGMERIANNINESLLWIFVAVAHYSFCCWKFFVCDWIVVVVVVGWSRYFLRLLWKIIAIH